MEERYIQWYLKILSKDRLFDNYLLYVIQLEFSASGKGSFVPSLVFLYNFDIPCLST